MELKLPETMSHSIYRGLKFETLKAKRTNGRWRTLEQVAASFDVPVGLVKRIANRSLVLA